MAKIAQLVEGNYNILDNIPVINQDLTASGFTPVANTYYRHTGATTDTFTQGVIYFYDTAYHKLGESGGGISDVKVNGTSIVTDGVANIPPASESVNGVVTTGPQEISGKKDFYDIFVRKFTKKGRFMNYELGSNDTTGTYGTLYVQAANSEAEDISYYFYDDRRQRNYIILNPTSKGPDAIILYNNGKSYKAMISPTTWSSGTSGSLTLTENGTYQFYAGSATKTNYTLLYVELGKESIAYAGRNVRLETDTSNVVHVYDMSQAEPVEVTVTLNYRRIGI